MTPRRRDPVGVLLAGGAGRRLGGEKAGVSLSGRPLAHWALDGLTEVLDEVVVACRIDTELPSLPAVAEAWVEPVGGRGPVAGIASSLREAGGRPIVVVALSLPLVDAEVVRALAGADAGGRPAVVARVGRRIEPLAGRYEPEALGVLAGLRSSTSPAAAAAALDPATVDFPAGDERFLHVNRPEDLLHAAAVLDGRRRARAL